MGGKEKKFARWLSPPIGKWTKMSIPPTSPACSSYVIVKLMAEWV